MKRNLYFFTGSAFLVFGIISVIFGEHRIQLISQAEAEGSPIMIILTIIMMFGLSIYFIILSFVVSKWQKEIMQNYVNEYNRLKAIYEECGFIDAYFVHGFGILTWEIVTGSYPKDFRNQAECMLDDVFSWCKTLL